MSRRTAGALLALGLVGTACTGGAGPTPTPTRSLPAIATDDCPGEPHLLPTSAIGTGRRLPGIVLRCLGSGRAVPLRRLGGKPLVVNLWASWCAPCRKEMPAFQEVYAQLRGKVGFLGVDTADSERPARELVRATGVTYPSVVDPEGRVRQALRAPGLPGTAFVDAGGEIVGVEFGEFTAETLRAAIRRHLGVAA